MLFLSNLGLVRPLQRFSYAMIFLALSFSSVAGTGGDNPQIAKLTFSYDPHTLIAGPHFSIGVVALDQNDRPIAASGHTVYVGLVQHSGDKVVKGELKGITAGQMRNGSVRFDALAIEKAASNYRLVAVIPGFPAAITKPFTVVPGPATTIKFLGQPKYGTPEAKLTPPLVVALFDNYGNLASNSDATVNVSHHGLPNEPEILLGGSTVRQPVGGVIVFDDLVAERGDPEFRLALQIEDQAVFQISDPIQIGQRFTFPGVGELGGVFDPSIEQDPNTGRLWMSYSSVELLSNGLPGVNTRLAFSDDAGKTWIDEGVEVNPAKVETDLPWLYAPSTRAAWWNEVSTLRYDPNTAQWTLTWHQFLFVEDHDPDTDNRRFPFGWIATKSAATPQGLADPNVPTEKLFAGSAYYHHPLITGYNERMGGGILSQRLDTLHPDMAHCAFFTEPGSMVTDEGEFISLGCMPSGGVESNPVSIVLLKKDQLSGDWQYVGTPIDSNDAVNMIGPGTHYNGSALFDSPSGHYLIVSPGDSENDRYSGCFILKFDDINSANLMDTNSDGMPDVSDFVSGTPGRFNGACGYHANSTGSGIIYGEWFRDLGVIPPFRLYSTSLNYESSGSYDDSVDNLLSNGDFEQGKTGWTNFGKNRTLLMDSSSCRGGSGNCLKLNGSRFRYVDHVNFAVTPSQRYDFSGYIKLTGLTTGNVRYVYQWYNGTTPIGSRARLARKTSNTAGFERVTATITAPLNATMLKIRAVKGNTNAEVAAYFDDIKIEVAN